MNKTELICAVCAETGLTKAQAGKAVNAVLSAMTAALDRGERVKLNGFGIFESKFHPARMARNPKTGEPVEIPAGTTVTFKAGCDLRKNEEA